MKAQLQSVMTATWLMNIERISIAHVLEHPLNLTHIDFGFRWFEIPLCMIFCKKLV